jgi:hypothetical protein
MFLKMEMSVRRITKGLLHQALCCVFPWFFIPFRSAGLLAIGAHAASRPWDFSIQPQSRTPHARKKAIAPSDTPRRGFITPAAAFYARTDPR